VAPVGTDPLFNPLDNFRVRWEWSNYGRINNVPGAPNVHDDFKIHGKTFVYDDNGNIKNSGNRDIYWTAFDKPHTIVAEQFDGKQFGSQIEYGPDFERVYKQEVQFNAMGHPFSTHDRTVYAGNGYQRITDKDGVITHRYTLSTGGGAVQIDRADNSTVNDPSYMLTDALGSTSVILDAAGGIKQYLSFDPWGARLNADGVTGGNGRVNSITNRGYTGHETDDETGLVNMNARIYDPYLGRFLSADPVLPDPGDMQAYNRYAYVLNNPLKYTDPTGNMPLCIQAGDPCGGGVVGASGIGGGAFSLSFDLPYFSASSSLGLYLELLQGAFDRYGERVGISSIETSILFAIEIGAVDRSTVEGQGFTFTPIGFDGRSDEIAELPGPRIIRGSLDETRTRPVNFRDVVGFEDIGTVTDFIFLGRARPALRALFDVTGFGLIQQSDVITGQRLLTETFRFETNLFADADGNVIRGEDGFAIEVPGSTRTMERLISTMETNVLGTISTSTLTRVCATSQADACVTIDAEAFFAVDPNDVI